MFFPYCATPGRQWKCRGMQPLESEFCHCGSGESQDWFPLGQTGWTSLQSKGLSSLLQHHSSKASILRHSAFFTVQLSHPYVTTGKTIALTRQTFVDKVMSLHYCWVMSLLSKGLSSLLQHHSSESSVLQHSAFFMAQLSHLYMTNGKTIVLTKWTFVSKVMSLLLNMLSRLV